MKINFAQVPHEDIDTFGESGLFGPNDSGDYFYNYVEYGTNNGGLDEVSIVDGCGRYMPISVEHISDLIVALEEIQSLSDTIKAGEALAYYAESNHDEAYVDNTSVKYTEESI